jgi:hypothetical protein
VADLPLIQSLVLEALSRVETRLSDSLRASQDLFESTLRASQLEVHSLKLHTETQTQLLSEENRRLISDLEEQHLKRL